MNSNGAVEIDVEARRVRVAGGEWRRWSLLENLAFDDGRHEVRTGLATALPKSDSEHYRAFYDCGVAAARVAPTGDAA